MKFLNNINIKTKIRGAFAIIMVLSIILGLVGVFSLKELNLNYSSKLNYSFKKLVNASDSTEDIVNLKAYYRDLILYSNDSAKIEQSRTLITQKFATLDANVKETLQLLNGTTDPDEMRILTEYQKLEEKITTYKELVDKVDFLVTQDKLEEAKQVINIEAIVPYEEIMKIIGDNYENAKKSIEELESVNSKIANSKQIIMNTVLVFVVLISILLAEYISHNIASNIIKLLDITKKIANGDLEVQAATNNRDELGLLSNNMATVIDTIKRLISRIDKVTEENLVQGDMDASIDTEGFNGSYKIVTESINNLLSGVVNDTLNILDNISDFGDGHFDTRIDIKPGKKSIMNEKLSNLRDNLKDIYSEIDSLSESGKKGELNKRIETDRFKGDWKKVALGLNDLLISVSEPFTETIRVTEALSRGDLSLRITSSYKGDFLILKNTLNTTMDTLSLYIKDISDVLNKMSSKNFDFDINTDYMGDFAAIKDSFHKIMDTFNGVLSEINSSADQLSGGARQISESSMNLAQGATNQSDVVKVLVSSVDMISKQTESNANNATLANQMAITTKEKAAIGNKEMRGMLKSMEEINQSSANISKIIKVIDEIAFQTNLLALNAAVEAARAGQHGKGFAVVAEEVRSLAARSKNAAKETTELIQGSVRKVEEGTSIANQTAATLEDIVSKIGEISELVGEVAKASNLQTDSISEINNSINIISDVTQVNTSTSQEQAAASQELSSQSEVFKNMVSQFVIRDSSYGRKVDMGSKISKISNSFTSKPTFKPVVKEVPKTGTYENNSGYNFDNNNYGKY